MADLTPTQLNIESMTRDELFKINEHYREWSCNTPFYSGKVEHPNFVMWCKILDEMELRRKAL